jgi:alpha-beta hydrolase superfamily lysophospholipase
VFLYPERVHLESPDQRGYTFTDYEIPFRQTRLHAWHISAKERPAKALIVHFHGNAENISTHYRSMLWLVDAGYDVLTFDYPGFGKSEGTPQVPDSIAAGRAVIRFAQHKFCAVPQILYGQSFGGALVTYLAGQRNINRQFKVVIIESAFSSYRGIVRDKLQSFYLTYLFSYPVSWFFSDRFAAVRQVSKIAPVPVLIAHAKSDPIVPFYHAEELFSAASSPKVLISQSGGSHSGIFQNKKAQRLLLKFLNNAS